MTRKKKNNVRSGVMEARRNTLTELDMAFIINYDGDAKNAALAAGVPESTADHVGRRILAKEIVMDALLRRNEAALKVIEGEGKKAAVIFAKNGVTIDLIARTIKKVLDSPSHEKSGYAAHAKMADLAANILGLKSTGMKIPPGSTGGVQQGEYTDGQGRRFFMYRAAWVKDPDDLSSPSHQRTLQASNG